MYKELFNIKSNDNKFWELLKSRLGLDRKNLLEQHSEADIDKGWAWDGSRIEDFKMGVTLDFHIRNEEEVGIGKNPKYYYLKTIFFKVTPDKDYNIEEEAFRGELPLGLSLKDKTAEELKRKLGTPDKEMYFSDKKTVRVCRYNQVPFIYKAFFEEETGFLKNFQMHYDVLAK